MKYTSEDVFRDFVHEIGGVSRLAKDLKLSRRQVWCWIAGRAFPRPEELIYLVKRGESKWALSYPFFIDHYLSQQKKMKRTRR